LRAYCSRPGIVEDVKRMVLDTYGALVTAQRTMIPLPNGYVLKGRFHRGVGQFSRRRLRSDVGAGRQMLNPALVISMRAP
jgi:hypothetical protein